VKQPVAVGDEPALQAHTHALSGTLMGP
jgi:hypothetical protein